MKQFKCDGCGELLDNKEVIDEDGFYYHITMEHVCGGNYERCLRFCPEPVICGPVYHIEEEKNED